MLQHYFKIAFRNLWKYKTQSIISIIGLAVGFACFTFGYNWMKYETTYDGFYPESSRTYRVYGIDKQTEKTLKELPFILSEKLAQDFPEVEKVAMTFLRYSSPVTWEEKALGYPDFIFVDDHFLELFPPKVICGSTDRLLHIAGEVVITEDFARKHWASPEDALGKVLSDRYVPTFTIVAVVENPPANSNFPAEGYRPDFIVRQNAGRIDVDKQWTTMNLAIYVRLHANTSEKAFRDKLRNYAVEHQFNENLQLEAIPITDMRHTLGSDLSFNITYIRTFTWAGLLLLFCAIFNFLNLYVNRILQRTRETKLRKTLGGNNYSVTGQMQVELTVHLLLSFIVSSLLLFVALPFFEQRFETQINGLELTTQFLFISLAGYLVVMLIGLLFASRFVRFSSLSQVYGRFNNKVFRSISICVQLAICVFFLMSSVVFYRQVSFMNHFDWGFKKEGLIKMTMESRSRDLITRNIAELPGVSFIPTGVFTISNEPSDSWGEIDWADKPASLKPIFQQFNVGENFLEGFHIPLLQGRFFKEEDVESRTSEWGYTQRFSDKIVINETMARLLGKDNPIGEKLRIPSNMRLGSGEIPMDEKEVIGVIKDFHTTNLHNPIYPLILSYEGVDWRGYYNYVRVADGTEEETIPKLAAIFKKHESPGDPDTYKIISMNQQLSDMSKSEQASLQLFSLLSTICIIIAVFGIYSISSSNMERRKKEVAIRKVSGATAAEIVRMFLAEYFRILIVANVIAIPFALFFMNRWLEQYQFRIHINVCMVILVLIITLALVVLTIFRQATNEASKNPAEIVKSE